MHHFIPKPEGKTVATVRVDLELLEQVDREAASVDISRNRMINQCIAFAMSHMEMVSMPPAREGHTGGGR